VESVAPSLQGGVLRQEGRGVRVEACGASRELRPVGEVRSHRPIHSGPTHLLEQRLARRLVLPSQRRESVAEVYRPGAGRLRGELVVRSHGGREAVTGPAAGGVAIASPARFDGGSGGHGIPPTEGDASVPASTPARPNDTGSATRGEPDVTRVPHPRGGPPACAPDGGELQGGGR
jgi:hypothetical protein